MKSTISQTVFYHIYPLGMGGCPQRNDFCCPAGSFFEQLTTHLDQIKALGCNALYIGPVFESTSHGYDTLTYFYIDRRLGNNQKFKDFCQIAHSKGFKIVLDAVFNHTGRDFFAFKDLQKNGKNSQYKDWYLNINFDRRSNYGDPFDYDGWAGCKDLVKLNVDNPQVREHLFSAVKFWYEEFGIDGLRLDAADVLTPSFMEALHNFCTTLNPELWLMGEVVHGDYKNWVCPNRLDSVTNYELYKGLWSSFNSRNFFELAYSLNRQYGEQGIYKNLLLYNFADNHDVNRIASTLTESRWLFVLYGLLFTIPGIPSIYYGSEAGICGKRDNYSDHNLRPFWDFNTTHLPDFARPQVDSAALMQTLSIFSRIRSQYDALKQGNYRQLAVSSQQFAFMREFYGQKVLVAVNSQPQSAWINIKKEDIQDKGDRDKCLSQYNGDRDNWLDVLNGVAFPTAALDHLEVPAFWLRILVKQ